MPDPTWQCGSNHEVGSSLYILHSLFLSFPTNDAPEATTFPDLNQSQSANLEMGNCSTSSSTAVATAKLILPDGRLQEFSYPIKASYVLQKYPMRFICNSDEMDFDNVLTAIDDNEELQPGQLYFALPTSRLKHPLLAEEMAALAVKASSALMKTSGGEKCGCGRKQIVFSVGEKGKYYKRVSPGVSGGDRSRRGRNRSGGGGGKFTEILSAIPE